MHRPEATTQRVSKAGPVALVPGMTAARAFQAIAQACLRHFRLNEPILIATRNPEALHQARVAIRRLRSALSIFDEVVDDGELAALKERLRRVSGQLGEARDLDVHLDKVLRPRAGRDGSEPGLADLVAHVEEERGRAYDRVIATLQSRGFKRLLVDLVAWIEAGSWLTADDPAQPTRRQQPVEAFAADVLDRRRRTVKKRGRRLAHLDPEARHRVRIAAKKLRYASEFFAALVTGKKARRRHRAFVAALEDLQSHLGDLNDIATGHELAVDLARRAGHGGAGPFLFAAGHVTGEEDEKTEDLLRSAAKAHRVLVGAKPFWR